MKSWHIHIEGQVQGVGFRPFVFSIATEYGLSGWVNNDVDGVHIEVNAVEKIAREFYQDIINRSPELSIITTSQLFQKEFEFFDGFQIIQSKVSTRANLLITPDFALCEDCRSELHSDSNRRSGYPFITCTNCGPRVSIIHRLPYDRINTKMDNFLMCSDCNAEYDNPLDRRYYSQTNSCPKCPIELSLLHSSQKEISKEQHDIIDMVIKLWSQGNIVAIKGIGGYILTCDATNKEAVIKLRSRKHRPSKPLALMFPNISMVTKAVDINEEEIKELCGHVSPIVLSEINNIEDHEIALQEIAPGLSQLGVMIPYTPLYDLLLNKFKKPIVATSGNVSNSPIVFHDQKAIDELFTIADYVLSNNRKIVIPQDDSVVKYTPFKGNRIVMRRSRGLAPSYINSSLILQSKTILATGAELKSTFSYLYQNNIYISQYLGDLEHFDTELSYKLTVKHFLKLFDSPPEFILCDKHKEYASTIYGSELSNTLNIPIRYIQHHIAHFGAIIGESNLIDTHEPVLGVIWDGTGLGNDGQIWGGEFFLYRNHNFQRISHFDYFDFILGDKMPREPRISALSLCKNISDAEFILKEKFSKEEWNIYNKIIQKQPTLLTSSVGRLFDGVASLLNIMDTQSYEGEAAMLLEAKAMEFFKSHTLDYFNDLTNEGFGQGYIDKKNELKNISTTFLISNILVDLKKGMTKDYIAAKFHFSLVKQIVDMAEKINIKKIAFSGGVFQNSLLVDLILHHLGDGFDLYFHQQLSPNDENISFGQLVCHQIELNKKSNSDL